MNLKKYTLTCFHLFTMCLGVQTVLPQPIHRMFVILHGTLLPVPHHSGVLSWIKGDGYLNGLRFKGMYSHQAIGVDGLHKIEDGDHVSNLYTPSAARLKKLIELQHNTANDLEQAPDETREYFVFGWEGQLKYQSRVDGARALYHALTQKKAELSQNDIDVQIELWTHSHAGNVALYLAHIEEEQQKELSISRLVMFGTPVHIETHDCVKSSMFENIFHFYSQEDTIQVCDCFTTAGWVRRTFDVKKQKNLYQLSIQIDDHHPSHYEMVFFAGSRTGLYRKKFPLHPLPCIAFAPQLIQAIEQAQQFDFGSMRLELNKNGGGRIYYASEDSAQAGAFEFTLPQNFFSH